MLKDLNYQDEVDDRVIKINSRLYSKKETKTICHYVIQDPCVSSVTTRQGPF